MKPSFDARLSALETLTNAMNDSDSEWWPFVCFRPPQEERLSSLRCLALSVLYGTPAALLAAICGMALGDAVLARDLLMLPLIVCAVTFVLLRLGVAFFWNRRAVRLRMALERADAWRRATHGSD